MSESTPHPPTSSSPRPKNAEDSSEHGEAGDTSFVPPAEGRGDAEDSSEHGEAGDTSFVPPAEGRGDAEEPPGDDAGGQIPTPTQTQTPSSPSGRGVASADTPPHARNAEPQGAFRSALLLGSDHTELGEVAIEEITPNLAIGISCGRFPKGYPHVDPNEDALFATTDGITTILAVADGHHGFDAARAVITAIAEAATLPRDETAQSIVRRLTITSIDAVTATVPPLPPPRDTTRTAVTVAVIRDDSLATTTIGDTACFIATRRRARRLGTPTDFLSPDTDPAAVGVETVRLPSGGAVVVASDGFLDFVVNPRRVLRSVSSVQASNGAERLLDAAFSGGAGDNISIAIARRS